MNPPNKRALGNLLLAVMAFAFAYGTAELLVRTLMADTTMLFPRYHTDYRYGAYRLRGIRPNEKFLHTSVDGRWQFVTNGAGFRNDRDFAYDKPPDVLRVLVLGDSHTQGYEVRQDATYAEVLHRYLGAGRRPVEVLNAGVSGFGTAEELAFLENEGYRYRPDVVVLGFYSNDFEDNFRAGLFDLDGGKRLVEKKREHVPGVEIQNAIYLVPGIKWLGEHSYFYSLLFNSVWEYFKGVPAVSAAEGYAGRDFAVPLAPRVSEEELTLATRLVERMQAFCKRQRMRLILLDIPTRLERYSVKPSVTGAMRERLRTAGVEIVPSERLFQSYGAAVDLHVPHGHHHISEFTHALIGVELGRRILGKAAP